MLIDGILIDTKKASGSGLNIYCRLEGMDYQYLTAGMHKKSSRKVAENNSKKYISRKLFGF